MEGNIRFSLEARIELKKALCHFDLYGLEDEFMEDLLNKLIIINQMPYGFQARYKTVRIVLLDRFDYSIHFRVKSNSDILIYHILSQRQNY